MAEPQGDIRIDRSVVLVVDDDVTVLGIFKRALADDSYQLVLAGSAEAAMEWLSAEKLEPNLAIIDVSLRGTDGPTLAALLRRSQPALPVLFVSGYGDVEQRAALGDSFLAKPFNPTVLARCVRELLTTGYCADCAPVKIAQRKAR